MYKTSDPFLFHVIPETDGFLYFGGTGDGSSNQADFKSSNVYIGDGAVKEPYIKRPGVLDTVEGGSFSVETSGEDALNIVDILEGLELGKLVF